MVDRMKGRTGRVEPLVPVGSSVCVLHPFHTQTTTCVCRLLHCKG